MNIFKFIVLCALITINSKFVACSSAEDAISFDSVPKRSVFSSSFEYVRNHALCMGIIGGLCGYIYVNSVLESLKPNPYEGPLKEAHEQIAALEKQIQMLNKAIILFSPLYEKLAPMIKGYAVGI